MSSKKHFKATIAAVLFGIRRLLHEIQSCGSPVPPDARFEDKASDGIVATIVTGGVRAELKGL